MHRSVITALAMLLCLMAVGSSPKAANPRLSVYRFALVEADSLLFNSGSSRYLLVPGGSNFYRPNRSILALSTFVSKASRNSDTQSGTVQPLPSWMRRSYGRPLPKITPQKSQPLSNRPVAGPSPGLPGGSGIDISGAKTFRFATRSVGSNDFGQSLDLNINGELSPGLLLSGSITDRGYNPTYGTANSRLSELDRMNLSLTSSRLSARVGDIFMGRSSASPYSSSSRGKAVSGAAFELNFPNWHFDAAAARPRGEFATYSGLGSDGFQGPYQIGDGGKVRPVVPGSEAVWLDGEKLNRGANKDYTIDYPTGRVTFTVNHPIDSRSRIEIDYEPQATDYKKELLAVGGGARSGDSSLFLEVRAIREGDARDKLIAGDLSRSDIDLLAAAGDLPAMRSGVTADSGGSYLLVNDSTYQYVGDGNGDHTVKFSYVGSGKGGYSFRGGENYEYAGSGSGDYAPVILLPAAKRNDYYSALIGSHTATLGDLELDLRTSHSDKNLWSDIDDDDNRAVYYQVQSDREWISDGRRSSLHLRRRFAGTGFRSRQRLNRVDFNRAFGTPDNFRAKTDETINEIATVVSPTRRVELAATYETLRYANRFDSRAGRVAARWELSRLMTVKTSFDNVASNLKDATLSGDGHIATYRGELELRPASSWQILTRYENDRRDNEYFDNPRGVRYENTTLAIQRGNIGSAQASGSGERVVLERYVEDSLVHGWREVLQRHRLSSSSSRRLGNVTYDATLSYRWQERSSGDDRGFLGRISTRYSSDRHRLRINSAYMVSQEKRHERGITYLEVEPGRGKFVKEDGRFVPDVDGSYIEVEEILSDMFRVRRGQKSFQLNKDWRVATVRFSSNIEEELKPEGQRSVWWLLPFVADEGQPYLFFSRRYYGEIRLGIVRGFHVVNIILSDEVETRDITGTSRERRGSKARLAFKEAIGNTYLEQGLELFRTERDSYFSGSGNVAGYELSLGLRQVMAAGELSGGSSFRRTDSDDGSASDILAFKAGSRIKVLGKGELRTAVELYRQSFGNLDGAPSYLLSGNRPGEKGVLWSTGLNYGINSGVRLNFSLSGRHAEDQASRVIGRGEVVAAF